MELVQHKTQDLWPQRFTLRKVFYEVESDKPASKDPEDEEITIASSEDFLNMTAKIASENAESLRVSKDMGYPYYTIRTLIKL